MKGLFKRKKHKCLMCEKRIGDSSPIVRYSYEGGKIGEARLCNKCANKLERVKEDDEYEKYNESF